MFTCTKAVHHVKEQKKLFSVCCLHYNSSTHWPKGHGLRSDTGCCACLCGWIEECVINTHAAAVHLSSCLKMSKKPYLHGVEMGKGPVIDSDVWSCCCKRGVRRWMQPWNESEIMILASLQFRNTVTSAYMYSASLCAQRRCNRTCSGIWQFPAVGLTCRLVTVLLPDRL